MRAIFIFAFVAVIALNCGTMSAVPLTKWFKTDNNTYYIEEQEKFTWQQSYDECQKKKMSLITVKAYKEDDLLLQHITQSLKSKPEFWLKAHSNVDFKDINNLLGSMLAADIFNISLDGVSEPQIVDANNPENCALTVDGTLKACETLHGYICHEYKDKSNAGQNIQNIILKFN